MKERRYGKRKYVFLAVIALTMAIFAFSFSVFAVDQANWTSTGGSLSYFPQEILIEDQQAELENCGFNVSTKGTTEVTLSMDATSSWGGTGTSALQKKHANLVETGILSYYVYDNSMCNIMTDLVVCLDFSKYKITNFGDGFLSGLTYAITGSLSLLGQGSAFTETTDTGVVSLVDAAAGTVITDKRASLYLRGISQTASRTSTLTFYDLNNVKLSERTIMSYSLHITLPRNTWAKEISTISFKSGSLTSGGIAGLSASPPTSIGLDLSNISFAEGVTSVSVASDATDGDTNHFHYICSTSEQLGFATKDAMKKVLSPSFTTQNYVEEIFTKPFANSHFCRAYAGVGKENGNAYVSYYDQPTSGDDTHLNRYLLVQTFYGLATEDVYPTGVSQDSVEYRHYERDENDVVVETAGIVTCDWTGRRVTLSLVGGGRITGTLHSVSCTHVAGAEISGYFSLETGAAYVYDDETGLFVEYLPTTA